MSFRRFLLGCVLGRRRPNISGDIRIHGIDHAITIRRGRHGIPMIEADSDGDAAFAIGYCQGQDRAFQLETFLRIGRGTIAELIGIRGVPTDRFSRRLGFYRSAQAQMASIAPDIRTVLERFAAGVTAGHTIGLNRKPHEFAILGGKPTPWTAADVITFLKLSSFLLPSNWDVELARLQMLRMDTASGVQAVDPSVIEVVCQRSGASETSQSPIDALIQDLKLFQEHVPRGGGSNSWLIAGSRTTSGRPLLASDPHLAPNIPPPWYLVHVRTPTWAAAGATFAGTPAIVIGHNGHAAWGVTAGLTDNTDLFLETIGPDGRSVRNEHGAWVPCTTVTERILVKGGADIVEEVLITPRGPIITPLVPGLKEAVSLRAVWLDPLPLRGFFDAPRATSFDHFRKAFAEWPGLPLNLLYADSAGETGWQLMGQLPQRRVGFGTLPLPADAPGVGWIDELLPFESMPYMHNPAAGYHATANEAPPRGDNNTSAFLGADFIDAYRGDAIREALAKRMDWDVPSCLALQLSTRSLPWEQVRELVLALPGEHDGAGEALALLRDWDGEVAADSPAACIFELFLTEMARRVVMVKVPNSWQAALGGGRGLFGSSLFSDRRVAHLVKLLLTQPAGWFERTWAAEMADALASVVRHLRARVGPGPNWWAWGHYRTLVLRHSLLGKSRWLGPVFNVGPVPCAGDSNTINQAGVSLIESSRPTHNMPNLRAVFDTAEWSNSRVVLCGGQSGNPCSPHYDDQFPLWQRGEAVPLPWSIEDVMRSTKNTLRITPAASSS